MIDDKVSLNVLKPGWGQMHQAQAETQINNIFLWFSLHSVSALGNEQTWQDISFCHLKGGGEFIPSVESDQN